MICGVAGCRGSVAPAASHLQVGEDGNLPGAWKQRCQEEPPTMGDRSRRPWQGQFACSYGERPLEPGQNLEFVEAALACAVWSHLAMLQRGTWAVFLYIPASSMLHLSVRSCLGWGEAETVHAVRARAAHDIASDLSISRLKLLWHCWLRSFCYPGTDSWAAETLPVRVQVVSDSEPGCPCMAWIRPGFLPLLLLCIAAHPLLLLLLLGSRWASINSRRCRTKARAAARSWTAAS